MLSVLRDNLKLDVNKGDLLAAHRIPNYRNTKPRAIIVRFLRREMQDIVIRARSKLKGTKMVIYEDLCRELQMVLNRLKKDERVRSSWSWRGRIYLVTKNDRKMEIHYGETLDQRFANPWANLPYQRKQPTPDAANAVNATDATNATIVVPDQAGGEHEAMEQTGEHKKD